MSTNLPNDAFAIRPAIFALALCLTAQGCVTAPPPAGFELSNAVIVAGPQPPPELDLGNVSVHAAGKGAGGGAVAGLAAGSVACLPTFVFYPACIALMAAAGAGVGATTGAVVGKVALDSSETIAARRAGLRSALEAPANQALLIEALSKRLREDFGRDVRVADVDRSASSAANGAAAAPWQIQVRLTEIGVEGDSQRFALRLVTHATVRKVGDTRDSYDAMKAVQSETELSEVEWLSADGKALHAILDRCLAQAARNLAIDLVQPSINYRRDPSLPPPTRNSGSCEDDPDEWTAHTVAAAQAPAFEPASNAAAGETLTRSTAAGHELQVNSHVRWTANCRASALTPISITRRPEHGTIETRLGPQPVTMGGCAGISLPGLAVHYVPQPGFTGTDSFDYVAKVPGQAAQHYKVSVSVE